MEPATYAILDRLGLRRPLTTTVDRILKENQPEKSYYLRRRLGSVLPQFVTSGQIASQIQQYKTAEQSGNLIQIEEYILSTHGGCTLVHSDGIYSEFVVGHLSGLLLRGWCGQRTWLGGTVLVRDLHQPQYVENSPRGTTVLASPRTIPATFERLRAQLPSLLSGVPVGTLVEFIGTDEDLWFVDCKQYPWHVDFKGILTASSAVTVYTKEGRSGSTIYDGPFDVSLVDSLASETTVILRNQAILSHFITRGLRRNSITEIRLHTA